MKKSAILILLLIIATIASAAIIWLDKRKIAMENEKISDLENKIDVKDNTILELRQKNDALEKHIGELSQTNIRLYQSGISRLRSQRSNPGVFYPYSGAATQSEGVAVVVYRAESCDYFILENSKGYIVAEWMGGNDPDVGDKLAGEFNSFGTKEFHNETSDSESSLWIDDYLLSKDDALDNVREQCK